MTVSLKFMSEHTVMSIFCAVRVMNENSLSLEHSFSLAYTDSWDNEEKRCVMAYKCSMYIYIYLICPCSTCDGQFWDLSPAVCVCISKLFCAGSVARPCLHTLFFTSRCPFCSCLRLWATMKRSHHYPQFAEFRWGKKFRDGGPST